MKRFWGHIWAASFTACIGGVLLPACAHDDSSMYIVQVVAPPKPDQNGVCLYAAPATNVPGLFGGVVDVALTESYSPVVMIGNQLNARGDQVNIRTETNRVQLRGTIVRVSDSVGNQLSTFTSLASGTVDPQVGSSPGLSQAALTIINPDVIKSLRGQIARRTGTKTLVSNFKVFGQTLGGTYIESAEFQFVVQACNGCLVNFPAEASDPKQPQPNCLAPFTAAAASSSNLSVACVTGQDQVTDCRLCCGSDGTKCTANPACAP